jgi:seryl-tRNA synthetase
MLDIDFIRDNQELLERAAEIKHIDFDIDELIAVDDKRRELKSAVDNKREKQNNLSDKIAQTESESERENLIQKSREIKEGLQEQEDELKETKEKWQELMMAVPNIPDMSVPAGEDESDNQEMKTWGQKPRFDFEPKSHVELMEANDLADFERGTKVHGFRGYFLTGMGAQLSWAVWNYARDFFANEFQPMLPPAIVRKQFFYGTGHLPSEAEDLYQTQDDAYLSGTSEVPMMAYHANEVLEQSELPKKYLAFSPCYRREAGSHGKDTEGVFRVHELYKLEQLILCEASHQRSVELHEEINQNTEEFLQSLQLPYQQVNICGGDLMKSQVKSYDLKLWVPSQKRFREISSASYYHDYQTRRFNIKYEDDEGNKRYVHSLNGTAIPTPRVLIALLENNQNKDGSIDVPQPLQEYLGTDVIGS